jgi:hypothetical protein
VRIGDKSSMTIDRSRASSREKSVFSRREKLKRKKKQKTRKGVGGGGGWKPEGLPSSPSSAVWGGIR